MKSKKTKQTSNSDDFWINKSDSESESIMSISSSSDSEIVSEYKPKSKNFRKSDLSKKQYSSSEPSLESTSSNSESGPDQTLELDSDSASEASPPSSNEYEIESESSIDSDIGTTNLTPSIDHEIDKIIGINQPNFDESSMPLMFYVKYKNKSYCSCEWIDEDTLTKTKKGKMLHSIFRKNQTPFRPVHFFNQTVLLSLNDDDDDCFKLFKPAKVEFDEGFVTPEKIISIQNFKNENKYLVKWLSLDITESTWETEVSEDLIEKYEESNSFTHIPCYDHTENQDLREFEEIKESPEYKNDNTLTDYQVVGLNWLQYCWFRRVNSILADEMGLGKTIESISIIDCLSKWYPNWGPFLIVCPLSTISNWLIELENWTDFRVVCMMGSQESLNMIKKYLIYHHIDNKGKLDKEKIIFDVILISYENLSREINFITKFNFMYTILDEAQRIKNFKTITYQDCMSIRSYHKLLMTGTPIQNNLYEIWSLLHYVDPTNFTDFDLFKSVFDLRRDPEAIEKIQEVIRPYILRRKKNDVNIELPEKEETIIEVEMTQVQRNFSQLIFKNNLGTLKDVLADKVNLNNIMMQLRKLFCHPFLISKLEDICYSKYKKLHGIPKSTQLDQDQEMESLVLASGKTILIDKLLPKLKEGNHKVLIFSQMTKMLDIIEDYLIYKDYLYERLDGSCSVASRTVSINRFQNDENVFIFLLSTRAGGLGINLTGADTVIIYDGDWNPQNDIQAQARCHRIGQTKKVNVYRLITRGCYESEMFSRASQKLALDFAILDSNPNVSLDLFDSNGQLNDKEARMKARLELQTILRKGAYYTFNDDPNEIDKFCSENIDQILDHRSHSRKDLISGGNSKFSKVSFETGADDAEINKNDFWNKLIGVNSSSEDDGDDENFSFDSGIKTRQKKNTKKVQKKEDVELSLSLSSYSSSASSSNHSRSSSPSSYSYSYYTTSDNDFDYSGSNKVSTDDDEESMSAVPDDYDDYENGANEDDYDDDIIEVNQSSNKSSTKKKDSILESLEALNRFFQLNANMASKSGPTQQAGLNLHQRLDMIHSLPHQIVNFPKSNINLQVQPVYAQRTAAPNNFNYMQNTNMNVIPNINVTPSINMNIIPNANMNAFLRTNMNSVPNTNMNAIPNTNMNAIPNTNINAIPRPNINTIPGANMNIIPNTNMNAFLRTNINAIPNSNMSATLNSNIGVTQNTKSSANSAKVLNTSSASLNSVSKSNQTSNSNSTDSITKADDDGSNSDVAIVSNDDDYDVANHDNSSDFSDIQPQDFDFVPVNPTSLFETIKKINKSIDHEIYETAFECIKKHGIGGSRFFLSEFMQEIGKTLFLFAFYRLPPEENQKHLVDFHQYIPDVKSQVLKTPFLEFIDEKFLSNLFKGNEIEFIIEVLKKDELYKASLFVSNEKLPENYQFAPEMATPIGWSPIDDFVIITSSQISDIMNDEKLTFSKIAKDFPSLNEWIPKRLEIIFKEISLLIPHDYNIYENKSNDKMIPKMFGNIEKFKKLNDHVIHPKKLSINFQKKLLRVFYLYGIPKENGIKKIKTILKTEFLFNDENEDLILIFTVKFLIKAIKYKPDLCDLLKSLNYLNQAKIDDNSKVDIRWIKEEAIQCVASNLDLIFKVRENYSKNIDLTGLPDWSDVKEKCDWWNLNHDLILFKTTAFYGFLFNSMLCKFIPSNEIDDKTIISWRNEEVFYLNPIIHPKMNFLGQVLSYEKKKSRIIQILDFIKSK